MRAQRTRRRRGGWESLEEAYRNPVPGDILSCLDELDVKVIRVIGEEAHAHCPAHKRLTGKEDRHPSFSVNLEEGVFGCFSCGFAGRFVDLVREMTGYSMEKALEWARARGGVEKAKRLVQDVDGLRIVEPVARTITEADLALWITPPEEVLAERNISTEAAEHFGILWDPERKMWITPIREPFTNRLMGWQEKNSRYFSNEPQYVKKAETIFGFNEVVGKFDEVYVVESPLDSPNCYTDGYENVVATWGKNVSNMQLELLFDNFEVVIWALDNDRDGTLMTEQLLKAHPHKRQRVIDYRYAMGAKDPGEMTAAQKYRCFEKTIPGPLWRRKDA